MLQSPLVVGAILSFIALFSIELHRMFRKRRLDSRNSASIGANEVVRDIELGSTLRVQIFQRPGGSFGYFYLRRVDTDHEFDALDRPYWSNIGGPGSVFDTAERAEAYARQGASVES